MKKLFIAVAVVAVVGFTGTAFATQPDKEPKELKQVYCNQEGESGKWKAQIAHGQPNEHEQKLEGVFVHDQSDVTAEMDAKCAEQNQPPVVDVCENLEGNQATVPAGYIQKDKICVRADEPSQEPKGEVEVTTPEWKTTPDGGMIDPETGEVFYGK